MLRNHVNNRTDGGIWGNRDRFGNNTRLVLFYVSDLSGLTLDREIFVNDAKPAFLRQGDRKTRLGYRIHCRRQQRYIEGQGFGQTRCKIDIFGQNGRMTRRQQDIVEGQCFLVNQHRLGVRHSVQDAGTLYSMLVAH